MNGADIGLSCEYTRVGMPAYNNLDPEHQSMPYLEQITRREIKISTKIS